MRFILAEDVELELPDDWEAIVEVARKSVTDAAQKAREDALAAGATPEAAEQAALKAVHEAVNKKASTWGQAGEALRTASDGKCWYCEMRQERSDMPVDHFRPKGRVHGVKEHPGYWWKAFDWQNLRLSCTYCNSRRRDVETGHVGGKQDYFPVLEPPARQLAEADPEDRPRILDPLVDEDTKQLTFLKNGFASPSATDKTSEAYERADCSIKLYHLNHTRLTRARKQIEIDIRELVIAGQEAIAAGDMAGRRRAKKGIISKARHRAELSTAARIYLGAYKTHPWIQEIFDRDL